MGVMTEIRLPSLAKPLDLLHYWYKSASKPVENMTFTRFYFYFYFSYSSPKAVEKRQVHVKAAR
jgi:hypothetical protein